MVSVRFISGVVCGKPFIISENNSLHKEWWCSDYNIELSSNNKNGIIFRWNM
jgi:hypothetical protein